LPLLDAAGVLLVDPELDGLEVDWEEAAAAGLATLKFSTPLPVTCPLLSLAK